MKKIILFAAAVALLHYQPGYCENAKDVKPVAQIKGSVSDYRTEIVNIGWWDMFNDPILSGYIAKALQANYDAKIAGLRVSEYQQIVRMAFGKEFPMIGIGADSQVQMYSKNYIPIFSGTIANYTLPLTASYELDIWKKNWDKAKSQKKQLEAVQYDEKAALISIVSEVASVYLNVLKTDKDIEFQNQFVNLKNEKLNLVKARYNIGVTTIDEVNAAEKELTDANVALNEYKKLSGILKSALAVLIGESPDNISDLKFGSIDNIDVTSTLADKIKSDKILKRPDILKAETLLEKSKIDVNIARKEFLPDITITGQAGFNSRIFGKLIDDSSFTYGFAGNIFEALFTGGQRRANLKARKFQFDQMRENYQKTIMLSLKEVNDSLLSVKTSKQKNEDYINKIKLENENVKLTDIRYNAGVISYLDTIEPELRLISMKKDQIQSKTDLLINNVSLYKALGANF